MVVPVLWGEIMGRFPVIELMGDRDGPHDRALARQQVEQIWDRHDLVGLPGSHQLVPSPVAGSLRYGRGYQADGALDDLSARPARRLAIDRHQALRHAGDEAALTRRRGMADAQEKLGLLATKSGDVTKDSASGRTARTERRGTTSRECITLQRWRGSGRSPK